jgi:type II secretion system protein N
VNKTIRGILYLIVGVVSYLFFLLALFPLDAIVSHYLANVESQTKGAFRVSVSPEMDTSLLFDSQFKDFQVERKVGDEFQKVFYAPNIKLGLSLFSLISGGVNVHFDADLNKGKLSGSVALSNAKSVYDLHFKKVPVSELPLLAASVPVKIRGAIDGDLYFSMAQTMKDSEGDFKIKIFDLGTDAYSIKEANMDIPALTLSAGDKYALIQGGMEGGFLKLEELSTPGEDMILQLKGRVQFLRNNLTRSNINGKFRVSEKLETAVPVFGFLAEQKAADGSYPISILGDLKKPRINVGNLKLSDMLNL